ncbi:hypothetical protein GC176_08355 [bacterium]|nr:hypothetical protein [bacterium]
MTVFLDDSGTPEKPLESLPRDTQFVCAVAMQSAEYARAHVSLADHLACLKIDGFHATEIVNPKTVSPWKALSIEQRSEALRFLYSVLKNKRCKFLWCPINGEQFEGTMGDGVNIRAGIRERHEKEMGAKEALWKASLNAVIWHFADWADGRLAIVCEDRKGTHEVRLQQEGNGQLVLDGIIHAQKTARIHGLELADAAAYLLNRRHHTAVREKQNCFDAIITEAWNALQPRFSNVLDDHKK